MTGPFEKLNALLARHVPEQRIYMRTERTTRYFRATPLMQATAGLLITVGVCWSVIATSALLIDHISARSDTKQAEVLQRAYEARLNELSQERDQRALETQTAQDRFYIALEQISLQQSELLQAEEERRELATGLDIMQKKLQAAIKERDQAQKQSDSILAEMQAVTGSLSTKLGGAQDNEETLEHMTRALKSTVAQRDNLETTATELYSQMAKMSNEQLLQQQQNARIFSNLEQAVNVTLGPLEKALSNAGMNTDALIKDMRKSYSGSGGPLTALSISTKGDAATALSADTVKLFERLDRVGLAKLAVEKLPLAFPVRGGYRHTSGYGYRRDPKNGGRRLHKGHDLAGARGTAIVATGDGVVTFAGRQSGYGKLIKIRHINGFETYYAHLNRIRVKAGQRVSRGERIGDMGNTGRSTGVHLHYEVRINGNAVNPSKYMKASRNVF
ncbi:DUF5930 domain-containing protein [Amylibacter sp. IMCC11727]|uniref:DUF5930 domain-containing protein n=1 Tax=Amylibacter sp. IMCC11727 TaxID=3039851 RepID=UPI00244E0FF7|nr:DUF5930 domain-containing protein [Amylibacter sp. IMCC11727]WGI20516.1 DUF5930 domain-containing protein [Amylibacter sp. IMCC11727]